MRTTAAIVAGGLLGSASTCLLLGVFGVSAVAADRGMAPPCPCPGDADCSGAIDFNDITTVLSAWGQACPVDNDMDGFTDDVDCDDNDPNVFPGAPELCNGKDDDCDMLVDEDINLNTDPNNCGGCGLVCSAGPNQVASCVNGSCIIECLPGWIDIDMNPVNGCEDRDDDQDGWPLSVDCDDNNPNINPAAQEICDSIDNDCDGQTDEGFDLLTDPQNCGGCGLVCTAGPNQVSNCVFGSCVIECLPGWIDFDMNPANGCEDRDDDLDGFPLSIDCNDNDPNIFPGAAEICGNSIDDNCDGQIDEPGCVP